MSITAGLLLDMQGIARRVRNGKEPGPNDRYNLTIMRAYCEAILAGESLEPADIYHKAFNGKNVSPEDCAA